MSNLTALAATDAHAIATARAIEHDVFVASGFCDATAQRVTPGFEHLDEQSSWFLARRGDEPCGALRVVFTGREDLPVVKPFGDVLRVQEMNAAGDAAELGVALTPAGRGGEATLWLYREAYREAKALGTRYWLVVVEAWLLERLQGLHFPFVPLAEPRWYMGGHCIPALMDLQALEADVRRGAPDLAVFLFGAP